MKKFSKIIYVLIIILIIGAITFGIYTKKSFKETKLNLDSNKISNASLSLDEEPLDDVSYFNNKIKDLSELLDTSDLIIVGHVIGERELYANAVKTKIKIDTVIRNKSLIDKPSEIFIFEPSYFNFNTYISNGYNLMQNNKEYILFLKHLEVPQGYDYKKDELITFIPISTYFGKYESDNTETPQIISTENEIKYKDIKSKPILTERKEMIDKYIKIRNEIFNSDLLK